MRPVKPWALLSLTAIVLSSCTPSIAENPVGQPPTPAMQQPSALVKSGRFVSGEHSTTGTVRIVTQNQQLILELDQGFQTSNLGPDLVVALHRSPDVIGSTQPPAYPLKSGDYVVLAPLKQFSGAQQYKIPNNLDLANFQSAVIWCRQFNATFGAAPLTNPQV